MAKRGTLGLTWSMFVSTAAGIALLACRPALGQFYVGTDGRTNEANNRLGSNGSNGPMGMTNNVPTAEDRIYGNVTGLDAFHGFTPYRPPGAFTGALPVEPSQELRQVAGYTSPLSAPTYNQPQLWYTPQLSGAAPNNFQSVAGNGAYVPGTPDYRQPGDYRLGASLDVPSSQYPTAGQAVGGEAVDLSAIATPSNLVNAPIFGAHEFVQTPLGNAYTNVSNVSTNRPVNGGVLSSDLSQADVYRLRNEIAVSSVTGGSAMSSPSGTSPGSPSGPTAPIASANSGLLPPQPIQATIASQAVSATNLSASASLSTGPGVASTGQQSRQLLPPLPPPATQSPQYARLRQLLDQYNAAHPKTDEEANRLFREALQARREYEQSVASSSGVPGAQPGLPATPTPPAPGGVQSPPPPALDVGPIGSSIRASGLKQLVQEGEDLARHQHYSDAIGKFLNAREVDPNFMLINIDLANAELGAGFYSEAEQYLRQAFNADPALLMGKYDITSVIGVERIDVLVNDLKQLASTSDTSTPLFLLAYISYNTGDSAEAVQYLQLAQNRAGGQDEIVKELSDHWTLPEQPVKAPTSQPTNGQ
jgi:hypothetical protein